MAKDKHILCLLHFQFQTIVFDNFALPLRVYLVMYNQTIFERKLKPTVSP